MIGAKPGGGTWLPCTEKNGPPSNGSPWSKYCRNIWTSSEKVSSHGTTTAAGKRFFELRPVRHGPTQEGFHGILHSMVESTAATRMCLGVQLQSMKEKNWEDEMRAEESELQLRVPHVPQSTQERLHLSNPPPEDLLTIGGGLMVQPSMVNPRRVMGMSDRSGER